MKYLMFVSQNARLCFVTAKGHTCSSTDDIIVPISLADVRFDSCSMFATLLVMPTIPGSHLCQSSGVPQTSESVIAAHDAAATSAFTYLRP